MKFKYVFTFICWLFCINVFAAETTPLAMLQITSNQLLTALDQNKATLKNKPDVVHNIVREILLPRADITSMARIALGRDAWMAATPAQHEQFTQEFTTLVIRTYSSALAQYSNQKIKFLPMRDSGNDGRAQVNSLIERQDGPSIAVNYRCILKDQEWKVYDFSVDGISMIESFRSQFADDLSRNNNNIDALIQKLAQHNQKN